jgi:replicative DNA helicase
MKTNMEQQFIDIPEFRTIEQVANEATEYIDNRRKHIIKPLKTRWKKFNKACCGGIEPNMVFTIAGISGAGKSALANLIQFDLFDENSDQDIVILNFSLEMIGYRNIGRAVSSKLRKTTSELYSADSELSDTDYSDVKKTVDIFKRYDYIMLINLVLLTILEKL